MTGAAEIQKKMNLFALLCAFGCASTTAEDLAFLEKQITCDAEYQLGLLDNYKEKRELSVAINFYKDQVLEFSGYRTCSEIAETIKRRHQGEIAPPSKKPRIIFKGHMATISKSNGEPIVTLSFCDSNGEPIEDIEFQILNEAQELCDDDDPVIVPV